VTPAVLGRIERGEAALRGLGFRQFRVRDHGRLARIEIAPNEMPRALTTEMTRQLVELFKPLGYDWVTLDLEGYRQGSLNVALRKTEAG
jgi:uncharacterized protein